LDEIAARKLLAKCRKAARVMWRQLARTGEKYKCHGGVGCWACKFDEIFTGTDDPLCVYCPVVWGEKNNVYYCNSLGSEYLNWQLAATPDERRYWAIKILRKQWVPIYKLEKVRRGRKI
jgi:hypothetical protein